MDAIRIKVRTDGHVINRSAYIAVGVDMDGIKHVLGIWVQDNEGASFWAKGLCRAGQPRRGRCPHRLLRRP